MTEVRSESVERESGTGNSSQQNNLSADYPVGYACICGFKTSDKKAFTNHVMFAAARDGKGTHKSLGRINMNTGDVVQPPWSGRSAEERKKTIRKQQSDDESAGGAKSAKAKSDGGGTKSTDLLSQTQQIRVVPRVFTMDYTPIMRAAQDAATKFFNWRPDMPLENFIDTCLYLFFFEKGITLCGYIIDESLLMKEGKPDGS